MTEAPGSTKDRVLDAALASFGTAGYDGTSLGALAVGLGIRSRRSSTTSSPRGASQLRGRQVRRRDGVRPGGGVVEDQPGGDRVEAMVRAVFRVALDQPVLLGLLGRSADPTRRVPNASEGIGAAPGPGPGWMEAEMAPGRMRRTDAQLLLLSAYSTVVGVATEIEVLRAAGVGPTLRPVVQRRRELFAVSASFGRPGNLTRTGQRAVLRRRRAWRSTARSTNRSMRAG
ncbi:MAG: hypothetical protein Ct9H300mP31_17810 [Acidimicrobiaceae bacterium]|nr:MAG: hypothetical protein Ct9H300mP31_17810 [Acidimicrobiaceae bacterium]